MSAPVPLAVSLVVASIVAGCSDSAAPGADAAIDLEPDGGGCALTISAINGRPVERIEALTASDDQNDVQAGIQVEIEVAGTNLDDGAVVSLSVTKLARDPAGEAKDGKATIGDVTIVTDLTVVLIQASAEGCEGSRSVKLPLAPTPECFFIDPSDGVGLSNQHDKDPSSDTFDYDVIIGTRNAAGGTVEVEIGQWASAPIAVDADGLATFTDTVLDIGEAVQLVGKVRVKDIERSCRSTISVSTGRPPCTINFSTKPVSTSRGRQGLGVDHDVVAGAGMQVDIDVITSVLVDKVTMKVNGLAEHVAPASGGKATFSAFALPEGDVDLEAVCVESASGNTGASAVSKMIVDSKPPPGVSDFACELDNRRTGDVACCWTAVADEAQGTGVEAYDLRYSITGPVTAANWDAATEVGQIAAPAAGEPICVMIPKLALAEAHHFVVRAVDFVANNSAVGYPPSTPLVVDLERQAREGPTASSAWGQRIAAGDFNCDGFTDLAVGDPSDLGGRGRVSIYLGNPNGYLQQPTKFIIGTIVGGSFGAAVAALKNFDGDGDNCTDLAILASHDDTKAAKVYLYLGQPALFQRADVGLGKGAELIFEADSALTGRIANIASAGDIDGDLVSDLAIVYQDDGADTSEVWISYGTSAATKMVEGSDQAPQTRSLPSEAGVRLLGGVVSQGFATGALCGAGPLDGDDYGDLLIGAVDWQDNGQPRGAVYLLKGGARAAALPENIVVGDSRTMQISGGAANGGFGYAVGVVGDMDNDGAIEFAASDISVANEAGAVYVFNLGSAAVSSSADAVLTVTNDLAGADDNKLGQTLTCPAELHQVDIDNDGYADLLIGIESQGSTGVGAVLMFAGESALPASMTASNPSYVFEAPASAGAFAERMSVAEDINNDGYLDLIVGDPGASGGKGQIVAFF